MKYPGIYKAIQIALKLRYHPSSVPAEVRTNIRIMPYEKEIHIISDFFYLTIKDTDNIQGHIILSDDTNRA